MRVLRDQRGYTAIEFLVASVVFISLLTAVLTPFDSFWQSNARNTQQNESQDQARQTIDRLAADLRSVSGQTQLIDKAGATDIVFKTTDPNTALSGTNTDNEKRVRYCLTGTTLIRQEQLWTTATPPAVASTSACPGVAPWTAQNNSSATYAPIAANVVNGSTPIFTYDNSVAANVKQVSIDLLVDTTPGVSPNTTELKTAVTLRNVNQAPVATFTATAAGSLHVSLDATAAYDPEGTALTYRWCLVSNCSSASAIGTGQTLDYVASSTGSMTFYLDVWDTGGIMTESSQTVTVT
jgi:Tfp pilus assembly protein PilW